MRITVGSRCVVASKSTNILRMMDRDRPYCLARASSEARCAAGRWMVRVFDWVAGGEAGGGDRWLWGGGCSGGEGGGGGGTGVCGHTIDTANRTGWTKAARCESLACKLAFIKALQAPDTDHYAKARTE